MEKLRSIFRRKSKVGRVQTDNSSSSGISSDQCVSSNDSGFSSGSEISKTNTGLGLHCDEDNDISTSQNPVVQRPKLPATYLHILLENYPSINKIQLLAWTADQSRSELQKLITPQVLQIAVKKRNLEAVEFLLSKLPIDRRMDAINPSEANKNCFLTAFVNKDFNMVNLLLNCVNRGGNKDKLIEYITPYLNDFWSLTDQISQSLQRCHRLWKLTLSFLPDDRRHELHTIYLTTAFNEKNYIRFIQTLSIMELDEVIRVAREKPEIQFRSNNECRRFQTMCLSCDIIGKLYQFSEQYIIPSVQSKARMIALLAYNDGAGIHPRPRADSEARSMKAALLRAGFHRQNIHIKHNWLYDELRQWIKTKISEVRDVCSFLYVCIMTHGDKGSIKGRNGETGTIQDILHEMDTLPGSPDEKERLRSLTPAVLVIQACQGSNQYYRYASQGYASQGYASQGYTSQGYASQGYTNRSAPQERSVLASTSSMSNMNAAQNGTVSTDTLLSSSLTEFTPRGDDLHAVDEDYSDIDASAVGTGNEDHQVHLHREHSALIMSTRHTYVSYRNYFISNFSEQLVHGVHNEWDLCRIVRKTRTAMECHADPKYRAQVPVDVYTLKKDLILPRPLPTCLIPMNLIPPVVSHQ